MKNVNFLAGIALLAMLLINPAQATLILDSTGGNSATSQPALTFNQWEWHASEFSIAQQWEITDISGYLTGAAAGSQFSISIYNVNNDQFPDVNSATVYTGTATYSADGFNGVSGISVILDPGSYWVAFEVNTANGDNFDGLLPVFTSVNAPKSAYNDNTTNNGYTAIKLLAGSNYNFGVQINAVPVPASVWLFGSSLLAAVGLRKRQTV